MAPEHEPTPLAIGVIETDAFCDRCGFNLHSQKVWRDGRLGVLICRCPECGAHQTAGTRTAVTSVWLNRLAVIGLLIWVALGLSFIVGTFFMHLGIQVGTSDTLTTTGYETRDGRPVNLEFNNGAQQWKLRDEMGHPDQPALPATDVVRRTMLVEAIGGPDPIRTGRSPYNGQIPLIAVCVLGAIFTAGTFANACFAATVSWFWRRGWRAAWVVLPLLAATISVSLEQTSHSDQFVTSPFLGVQPVGRSIYYAVLSSVTVAQVLVTVLGLICGRSIARFVLTVIVPPGSRQLFAFLWHCDGKTMPARVDVNASAPSGLQSR